MSRTTPSPHGLRRRTPARRESESTLSFWVVDKAWQASQMDKLEQVCNEVLQHCPTLTPPPEMVTYGQCSPLQIRRSDPPRGVKNVCGDGNCFFRCISYLLSGREDLHVAVRHWALSHLSALDLGMPVARYIRTSRMDRPGEWASDHEILAAAKMLKTDIFVFSKYATEWKWMEFKCHRRRRRRTAAPKRSIYLYHYRRCHFQVVFDIRR